jgi:hypothetical protein
MLQKNDWQMITDVSVEYSASIFKVKHSLSPHIPLENALQNKMWGNYLMFLTMGTCELLCSLLVNSFCHESVHASDSKSGI